MHSEMLKTRHLQEREKNEFQKKCLPNVFEIHVRKNKS